MRKTLALYAIMGILSIAQISMAKTNKDKLAASGFLGINYLLNDTGVTGGSETKSGINIDLYGYYYIKEDLAIGLNIGYGKFWSYSEPGLTMDGYLTPLIALVKYDIKNKKDFTPYVFGGLGIFKTSIKYTIDMGDFFGTYSGTSSSSDFGIKAGGGILYPLNERLTLDMQAALSIIQYSYETNQSSESESGKIFTIQVGLFFFL